MRSQKNTIATESTIANQQIDSYSNQYINQSRNQNMYNQSKQRHNQRAISILTSDLSQNNNFMNTFTEIESKEYGHRNMFKHNIETNIKLSSVNIEKNVTLINVLQKVFFKKKRYSFQVLKQFILFPDETQSSIMSLSTYDPLIFKDQIIHSLVKILQTRMISNKIWAFINLRMMPYYKAAIKIQQKATKIYQKQIKVQKRLSFDLIKKVSQDAFSIIIQKSKNLQINSYLQTENKEIQCDNNYDYNYDEKYTEEKLIFTETKRESKNYLSSKILQQQYVPKTMNQTIKQVEVASSYVYIPTTISEHHYSAQSSVPVTHMNSTVRILSTEQYLAKYAMKPVTSNISNKIDLKTNQYTCQEQTRPQTIAQTPKTIRISASDYKNIYNRKQQTIPYTIQQNSTYSQDTENQTYIKNCSNYNINNVSRGQVFKQQNYQRQYRQIKPKLQQRTYVDYKVQQHNNVRQQLKQQQKLQKSEKQISLSPKINKYNIIHYYQKPREIASSKNIVSASIGSVSNSIHEIASRQCLNRHHHHKIVNSCYNVCECSGYSPCHGAHNHSCSVSTSVNSCNVLKACCPNHIHCHSVQKQSRINQTRMSQNSSEKLSRQIKYNKQNTFIQLNVRQPGRKSRVEKYNQNAIVPDYNLSQLSSRIQYLNFLRKVAQQQQQEQQRVRQKI